MTHQKTERTDRTLATCTEIEQALGAIYSFWSHDPQQPGELRALWSRLAGTGRLQSEQLRQLLRRLRACSDSADDPAGELARDLSDLIRDSLTGVRTVPTSPRESLVLAIRLEEAFQTFLGQNCQAHGDQDVQRLLRDLAQRKETHTRTLYRLYFDNYAEKNQKH